MRALLFPCVVLTSAFAAVPTRLGPTDSIQRQVAPGEEQRFEIRLEADEYASLTIEQRGIDLEATVLAADGTVLAAVNDQVTPDGAERIELVASAATTFTLVIKPSPSAARAGAFVILPSVRRPATEGDRRLLHSRVLQTRGREFERAGRYAEAQASLTQALLVAETVRAGDDPFVAEILFDLAGNALERQDNAVARALYERAIAGFDQVAAGSDHPYAVMSRSRVALLELRAGQRQKAEALIRDALPRLERLLGVGHPWYLQTRVTLASLRRDAGDEAEAERILRDVLAVVERTRQTDTLLHATLLNNLGDMVRARRDVTAAEALFRRALTIGEAVLGSDSLFVATELQNLGILARERKDYAAAVACYGRALAIREHLLGLDHPSLAGILTNLANVYRATGNDQMALDTHFRALRTWERALGPFGQETLLAVGNIARTYAGAGDIDNAITFQRRADAILETQMGLYLSTGSERQKLAFVRAASERTDRTISLHLKQAPDSADAASLAALVLLQRKGRVQDAMTDLFGAVRRRVGTADRELMDQLKDASASLARIALRPPATDGEDTRQAVATIEARKEQLEAALSDRSADFRVEMRPVTLDAVQAAIPGDAVLIEFAVFRPFDSGAERNAEAYGPPHYAAYVIPKHGTPMGLDLGAVEDIDPLIARMRDALRNPADTGVKARTRAVDERIFRPLRSWVAGATRLLVAPDGGLNLVPFEALMDEHGRYLIERYAITYLTSGRDLLRMQIPRAAAGRPVIVADPLFGEPIRSAGPRGRPAVRDTGRSVTVGPDRASLYFAPLSGSALEGHAIKGLFPDASLLTGRRANKTSLERLAAPRILHIASHGFFLDDAASGAVADNPLLRSGLALAGANLPDGAHGTGILTGLEAAGLNLWGTNLVTLSACDTGLGEVRNGEGVYGLRRAFMLAGSETLVMSLWPVTDNVARDTMVAYYARLRGGAGRGDALRQAKISIMKRAAFSHPYYWAAFIQSGDWSRLPTID